MLFKYVGDPKLMEAVDQAKTLAEADAAERALYSQMPYIRLFGMTFNKDEVVEVPDDATINGIPNAPLIVAKLLGNSHFEAVEEPSKKRGRPAKQKKSEVLEVEEYASNESADS